VTDQDILEFLHRLQSELYRPPVLFDQLRDNHLLFLGCDFPDWLARFFVRTLTNEPLSMPRDTTGFVADRRAHEEVSLSLFLRDSRVETYSEGSAVEFVDELYERWTAAYPDAEFDRPTEVPETGDGPATVSSLVEGPGMPVGSVFLSYASEDRTLVEKWWEALDDEGIDAWFDRRELRAGDSWDQKIRRNIRRCSLFVPFVSTHAQRRLEGYFRKEWTWALDRREGMAEELPFIVPVILGDLSRESPGIPPGFWAAQAVMEGPEPTSEAVSVIRELVRALRENAAGYR
jgi:hypothetical protein